VDRSTRRIESTLDREHLWLAQTPQGFQRAVLDDAIRGGAHDATMTDEAMMAEAAGHAVAVVLGDEANVKITTPYDLEMARARVAAADRVGHGYDLHRLVAERPLVLAGIAIPADRGPVGHSDADVICHALVDAIFGAAAAGDIGRHFPDSDPQWKGAAGLDLLARARAIVGAAGWRVVNADVTVILERPKLAPHLDTIRERLAEVLGVAMAAVSVKAKTNEGVDAVGRGEAIAAHAVACLAAGSREAR
jgi:2-C-methyl-D-erythritol 4-phosphate cytidylyltransferase/2-C-methyl-D-erythritol 2,4-cyclodiphosphate synthase